MTLKVITNQFFSLGLLLGSLGFYSLSAGAASVSGDLKIADIKANGMRLQIAKKIDLSAVATAQTQAGFAPAPNTLYFIGGQVFQKKPDQGLFALINLETNIVDKNIGIQLLPGHGTYDRCELDLLTALGAMTILPGTTFSLYDLGSTFLNNESLLIPLRDATRPAAIIGQFRCYFLEHIANTSKMADLRNVTGGRIDIVTP